jgi:hypothetical protein
MITVPQSYKARRERMIALDISSVFFHFGKWHCWSIQFFICRTMKILEIFLVRSLLLKLEKFSVRKYNKFLLSRVFI